MRIRKLVIGPGPGWVEQKQRYWDKDIEATSIDIIPEFFPDYCFDITEESMLKHVGFDFDEIEAYHVFEHIEMNKDFKRIMWECFDGLKSGGTLDICVPYWQCPSAIECFEHTRFFNENSFMNFYSNPYAKEMKLPLFELVLNEVRPKDGGREVHVILRKPYENA